MRPGLRTAFMTIACCTAGAGHIAVREPAASVAHVTAVSRCRRDADCLLNPVDCSTCGRCAGDQPTAVASAKVEYLRAECARHPPVRLNPKAAALGLRPPVCSPCPGSLDEPYPLWRAVCRSGTCAVEQAGARQRTLGAELVGPAREPDCEDQRNAAGSIDEDRTAAVRLAQATLARALRVTEEHLRVEDVRAVEWRDAALGCPEKGTQYAQVLVPGYEVLVDVDGTSHSVHVGEGRAVICDRQTVPDTPKYLQVVTRVQDLARRDLAARLKVEVKDVRVMRLRPVTWPDASLGCREPDRRYDKVETRGFLIELEHAKKTYRYHSDRERVVFCPR